MKKSHFRSAFLTEIYNNHPEEMKEVEAINKIHNNYLEAKLDFLKIIAQFQNRSPKQKATMQISGKDLNKLSDAYYKVQIYMAILDFCHTTYEKEQKEIGIYLEKISAILSSAKEVVPH